MWEIVWLQLDMFNEECFLLEILIRCLEIAGRALGTWIERTRKGQINQAFTNHELEFGTSLEKAMATHSSTLAWKIPWVEEPDRLKSMVSLRVRHDWATSLSLFTFMNWRRTWQPIPVFLPGESHGHRSLVGYSPSIVHGVGKSRTWLSDWHIYFRSYIKMTY